MTNFTIPVPLGRNPVQPAWDYIGVPYPTYTNGTLEGLGYTVWPYDPCLLQPTALPSPWTTETSGFHYVENGGVDGGNGNPTSPAGSLPVSPSAGDVIVVSDVGGNLSAENVSYTGTSADPIFIVAAAGDTPTYTGIFDVGESTHLIVDGITANSTQQAATVRLSSGDHVTFRNGSVINAWVTNAGGVISVGGCDHLMFYNNNVQGNDGTANVDHHGCKFISGNDMWFIDNTFHDCEGDGIQIGDANSKNIPSDINRVWVAGNHCYQCNQTGIWLKNCTDVVVSQNRVHDQRAGSSNDAMGSQYDNDQVWFIANECYDAEGGIVFQAQEGVTTPGPRYAFANVIYDITDVGFDPDNSHQTSAMKNRYGTSSNCYFQHNTMHGCDGGINIPQGNNSTVTHNIIGDPLNGTAKHLYSVDGSSSSGTVDYNYYEGATQRILWAQGGGVDTLIEFVAATIQEDNGISGTDPSFTNEGADDYSLQAGSACVDQGGTSEPITVTHFNTRYGIDINKDFANIARPVNTDYDIGAHER